MTLTAQLDRMAERMGQVPTPLTLATYSAQAIADRAFLLAKLRQMQEALEAHEHRKDLQPIHCLLCEALSPMEGLSDG